MFGFLKRRPAAPQQATPQRVAPQRVAPQRLRLRLDAASMSAEARKHWGAVEHLPADAALTPARRWLVADRARDEMQNNGYCSGIVDTLALHVVGSGPRLELSPLLTAGDQPASSCRPALDARERRWREWAAAADLADTLRLARIARCRDGEVFLLLGVNPGLAGETKLAVTLFETERVAAPGGLGAPAQIAPDGATVAVDGIEYDRWGNPTRYCLQRLGPWGGANGHDWVPAARMIHYANLVRPGQHRGLSELAPTLCVFNDLRRYTNAVLQAAENAACASFIVETDIHANDEDGNPVFENPGSGTIVDFERGSGIMLPNGWHANQLKSEQPTAVYERYVAAKVREAARALSMPLSIALGDSSGYNYASGRLDHQVYYRKVAADRAELERRVLAPLLAAFEALDRPLHPGDYACEARQEWMWDGFEHVDPAKEASAQATRLANGVTTLAAECARDGRDWEEVAEQRARERARLARLGLPTAAPAAGAPPEEGEEPEEPVG